jgi:hypothetical protein
VVADQWAFRPPHVFEGMLGSRQELNPRMASFTLKNFATRVIEGIFDLWAGKIEMG